MKKRLLCYVFALCLLFAAALLPVAAEPAFYEPIPASSSSTPAPMPAGTPRRSCPWVCARSKNNRRSEKSNRRFSEIS